jgi:replicative DNA helicase
MQLDGLDTPWKQVNEILGKVGPGNLITIAARPKAGKTTLAMNWNLYLAFKGYNSFNYQCEMEEEDMVIKYGNMIMNNRMPEIPEVEYTDEGDPIFKNINHKIDFEEACRDKRIWLKSVMLYLPIDRLKSFHPKTSDLIDDDDGEALDKVCRKITEAVQRFGCKIVIFDNLHFLCRGDKAKEQIDKASRRFKLLAKELQIVFVLITHPRKTNHNRSLSNDDLKDSASIFQDSDAVILLHRAYLDDSDLPAGLEDDDEVDMTQEGAMDSVAEIKVTARRHKGGKTNLYFNDERALFKGDGNDYLTSMKEKIKKSKKKKRK